MAKLDSRPFRERSAISTLHTADGDGPPFTVWPDCQLTRRKRHHIITDGRESVLFRSRWWSDILEWLANEGETDYLIITDRDRFRGRSVRCVGNIEE